MPDTPYEPEFIAPSDMTPDFLAGAVDETQPRAQRILDFAERVAHDSEEISFDVIIEQYDGPADIVGFSDSSKLVKGMKTTRQRIEPFHIKNSYPFKVTDRNGYVVRQGGMHMITREGVAHATMYLEQRRRNIMRIACLAMINDRRFTYVNGKKKIVIPYEREIGKLTTPSIKVGDASFDLTLYLYNLKQEFYLATRQMPDTIFMNSNTGQKFIQIPQLRAAFEAAQSSDPENTSALWDSFNYGGMNFNILHEQYPRTDGTLANPIDDNRIIATVAQVEGAGPESGSPIKIHSARNVLNDNDANSPYYDSYSLSQDPWAHAERMYDNMIPSVMKTNIVMQQDAVHT